MLIPKVFAMRARIDAISSVDGKSGRSFFFSLGCFVFLTAIRVDRLLYSQQRPGTALTS